ncbi:hypothetical protein TNCV_3479481 [Trichonephila clavipes]|nr:hypothetical protein TNCV_3479481 [Trichonephila clavipes]
MEEFNGSSSRYIKNCLMSKLKKIYELGRLFIKLRKPADMHTEHIKSELHSSKTLREISVAPEEGSISEIHYSETNSYSSLESSSDSERESEFSEGERFSSTESDENNLFNNKSKHLNENLENESIDITEVMDLSCNNSQAEILLSREREENKKNCSRKEKEENKNISESACLVKDKIDFSIINSTNNDLVGEGKNLDDNVKDKIISGIDHQNNDIENFSYKEISETDSQVDGIESPPCDELLSISGHSVLSSTVVKNDYKEKDNTTNRVNNKVEVTLNKAKETRSTENVVNESSEKSIKTREFAESNNSNSKDTEISMKVIDREAHGEITSKSRTKLLKCCSRTFDDLILEPRKVMKNARKCISLINLSVVENNDFKQNINHEEIISQGSLINNSDKEWKSSENAAKKLEKNLDNTHFAPFPPPSDKSNEPKNAGKCPVHTKNKNENNAKLNQFGSLEDVVENQSLKNETLRDSNNSTPNTSSKSNQNSVCNSIPKMSDGIVQITSKSGEQLGTNYCNEDTNDSLKSDPSEVKVKDVNSETIHSVQNCSSPQQLTVTRSTKVEKHHNLNLKQKEGAKLLGSGSRSNEKPEKNAHSKFIDLENNAQTEEDICKIVHDFPESSLMLSDPIINHPKKNLENDISYDVMQPKTYKKSTNVDDIKKSIHKNSCSKLSSKISIELDKKQLENKHSEEDISRNVHDFFINNFNTFGFSDPVVNIPENDVSDDVMLSTSLKNSLNLDVIKIVNEIIFPSKHENKDKNLVCNFKPETNTSITTSSTLNIENTSGNHSLKMDSDCPDILDAKYTSGSKDNTKETPKAFRKIRKPKRMLKRPVNLSYEEIPENNGLKNSELFSVSNGETSENGEKTKGNSPEKIAIPPMVGNDNFSKTNFQMENSLPGRKNDQESMINVEFPFKRDSLSSFSLELNSNKCPVEKKNDDIPLVNLIRTLSIDQNTSEKQNDNALKDKNLQNCYNNKLNIFWMNTSNIRSNDKESYKPLSSNKEFEAGSSSATSKAYENSVGQTYSKEMFNKHDVPEENKAIFNASTKATIKPHFNTSVIYRNIKTRQKSRMLKNVSKRREKKQKPKNIQRNFSDSRDNAQKQDEGHFLIARSEKPSHSDEKICPPVNELSPFTTKSLDETEQKLKSYEFGKQAFEGYVPNFTTMGKNQTVQEKTQTSSPQINMFSKDNSDTEKSKIDKDEKVSPRQQELSPFSAKSSDKTVQKLNSYTFGQQAHERAFPNFTEMGKNQVVLQGNKTQNGSTQINIFSMENTNTEKLVMDRDGEVNPQPNELSSSSTKSSGKPVQKFNSNIFVKQCSEVSFPIFTAMEKNQTVQQGKTQTGFHQISMFNKENCDTEKLAVKKDEKASPPENERSPFANKSSDKTVQKFNSYIFGKQAPEGSLLNFTAVEKNNQIIQQGHKPLSGPAQAVLGSKIFEMRDSWYSPNQFSKEKCIHKTERHSSSNFSELNKFDRIIEENEAPKDCSGNFIANGSFAAKRLSKRASKELGNEPVLNSDRKGLSEGKDAFSPRENSSDELKNIDLHRKNYLTNKSVREWLPSYLKYNENNSEYLLYGDSKFLVFKRIIAKHAKDIKTISQCLQMKKSKTSSFLEGETVFIHKEMSSSEKFSSPQNEAYTINNQNNQNESNICINKNMEMNYSQEQPFTEKINRDQKNQQFWKTTCPETEASTRKDLKNQEHVPGMNREFSRQDQDSRQPIKEREKTTTTSDHLFQENMRHNTKLSLETPDKLATNNAENQQNTQSNTSALNFQEDLNFDLQQDNEKSELKQHSTVQEIEEDYIFYVNNKRVTGPSSKVVRGTKDITTPQFLSEEHSTDISRSSSEYSLVETKKITKFPKYLNKRNSKHSKHRTYSRKHEILTSKNIHWENDERLAADDQVMTSDNTRSIAMINNEDLEIQDRIQAFTDESVDNQMEDLKPIFCLKCNNLNLKLYKPFSNITLHFGQNEDKENSVTEKDDKSDCKESVKSQNTDLDICSRTDDTDDSVTGPSNQLLISENREIGRIVSAENGKILHFENNSIVLNLDVSNDMEPTHFDYSHISGREQLNLKDKDKELFVEIEKLASNK